MGRPLCSVEGCSARAAKRYGKRYKKQYYRKLCQRHREIKAGKREKKQLQRKALAYKVSVEEFSEIKISECSLCGWDKVNCDIHRIKHGCFGGKYIKENIVVLCPNCHRLAHRGLIKHLC